MAQQAMTPRQSDRAVLHGLLALEGVADKSTGILPNIDKRLVDWGWWVASGGESGTGSMSRNPIAAAMEGASYMGAVPELISDEILDTDKAVAKLPSDQVDVVKLHYSPAALTSDQKAKRLGISTATYYRRLWAAHRGVLMLLPDEQEAMRNQCATADKLSARLAAKNHGE